MILLKVLQSVVSNPWFQIASFVLTVTGGMSPILNLVNKKNKGLFYSTRSFQVVNKIAAVKSLAISYENEPIEILSLTTIAVWYSGNETIKYPEDEPLIITLSESNLIKVDVIGIAEKLKKFECVKLDNEKNSAQIIFNKLKKHQGGAIQIIHTGILDNEKKIKLHCEDNQLRLYRVPYSKSRWSMPNFQTALVSAVISVFVNLLLFFILSLKIPEVKGDWYQIFFIILFTLTFNFICVWWLPELFLYGFIPRIPKEFNNFHNQSQEI